MLSSLTHRLREIAQAVTSFRMRAVSHEQELRLKFVTAAKRIVGFVGGRFLLDKSCAVHVGMHRKGHQSASSPLKRFASEWSAPLRSAVRFIRLSNRYIDTSLLSYPRGDRILVSFAFISTEIRIGKKHTRFLLVSSTDSFECQQRRINCEYNEGIHFVKLEKSRGE